MWWHNASHGKEALWVKLLSWEERENLWDYQIQLFFRLVKKIKTLSLIDNVKDNYPPYNKESFNDLLFELQEIVPLQNKYEQIMEEIKYANSTEEKNNYIRNALALKTMIKEKRSKKVGGK